MSSSATFSTSKGKVAAEGLASRKYEVYSVRKPLNRNHKPRAAKLKKSLKPGSVVIILSGRYRGHRAVFLKQLPSGLLLVSGTHTFHFVPHPLVTLPRCPSAVSPSSPLPPSSSVSLCSPSPSSVSLSHSFSLSVTPHELSAAR